MTKKCDGKSVGMLCWRDGKGGRELLLIERKKPPFGIAAPAGHVDEDGDDFEAAATRELEEETGLKARKLRLLYEGRQDNPCRRGGEYHYWKVYEVETDGALTPSPDEMKMADWYNEEGQEKLAKRTEDYLNGNISEEEWEKSPGLEPVWRVLLAKMCVLWRPQEV